MPNNNSSELDKIISEGKANPQTAMVVFAIEIRNLREDLSFVRSILFAFIGLIVLAFMGAIFKGLYG